MADEQFVTLICSQLKSELAHIAAKTPGRKCDLLQILYDDKIVSQGYNYRVTSCPVFTMLFTIQLSECEICLTFRCQRCCFRVVYSKYHITNESAVHIYVEYSQIVLNIESY